MMTPFCKYLPFASVMAFHSCQTPSKLHRLYDMDAFDIKAGNAFVDAIQQLQRIDEISVVDTKNDGNDFVVNNQWIFLDTSQPDQPNYYAYTKRANELGIAADSLVNCLKLFYKVGVNGFTSENNYYRFAVVVGFTTNKGYVYSGNAATMPGDTLPATAARNRDFHFKIVLSKQVGEHWFSYYEIR